MGENKILVYAAVIVLGSTAAVLAFAAEASRTKVTDAEVRQYGCNYPSTSITNKLGYIAAVLLLISQIIICAAITRFCCQMNTSNTLSFSGDAVNFIISCFAAAIGIILLVCATNLKTRKEFSDGTIVCYTVRRGMFAMGGTLAIIASTLGLTAYKVAWTKHRLQPAPAMAPHEGEIAMGYPHQVSASTYPNQQHFV